MLRRFLPSTISSPRLDLRHQLRPAGTREPVAGGIGDGADGDRERQPPRRRVAAGVVDAGRAEDRLHVDHRHAEPAALAMKLVDRLDDLARPRGRARALGAVVEVSAVHVDRDRRRDLRRQPFSERARHRLALAEEVGLHDAHLVFLRASPLHSSRKYGRPRAAGTYPRRWNTLIRRRTISVNRYGSIRSRFHVAKMTRAIAIQPRPLVIPSVQAGV